jgi:signal transduction histidine kinase
MNRLVTHPGPTAYEVYAGLLAHELRTPAAALQMAAHVLARQGVLEAAMRPPARLAPPRTWPTSPSNSLRDDPYRSR